MSEPKVVVIKTPQFRVFATLIYAEIISCMEWNAANVKQPRPNVFTFTNAGSELWRIEVKRHELRIISSLKKVSLRHGFAFNMTRGRLEVS